VSGLQRITEALEAIPSVLFALLFGSRAAGSPRQDSDWDLAVFFDPALSAREREEQRAALIAALEPRDRVDVLILNEAPPLLAHRALQGRVLLVRDRVTYSRFFCKTLAESGDEAHWRELHARARSERLREGRFGRP
jgi:predicted nucleotidyltransferase